MIDEIFKKYENRSLRPYEVKKLKRELQDRLYLPSMEQELSELYKKYDAVVLERNRLKHKNKRLYNCVRKLRKVIQDWYGENNNKTI